MSWPSELSRGGSYLLTFDLESSAWGRHSPGQENQYPTLSIPSVNPPTQIPPTPLVVQRR